MKMKLMINNKQLFGILHKKICTKSRSQFKFKYGWLPAKKNFVQPWLEVFFSWLFQIINSWSGCLFRISCFSPRMTSENVPPAAQEGL